MTYHCFAHILYWSDKHGVYFKATVGTSIHFAQDKKYTYLKPIYISVILLRIGKMNIDQNRCFEQPDNYILHKCIYLLTLYIHTSKYYQLIRTYNFSMQLTSMYFVFYNTPYACFFVQIKNKIIKSMTYNINKPDFSAKNILYIVIVLYAIAVTFAAYYFRLYLDYFK